MKTDHRAIALGKAIRRGRVELGLSQTSLTQRLRITFQQVQAYERGAKRVHFARFLDIAAALGTTPEAMLRECAELIDEASVRAEDAATDDRNAVRLMGLAHQVYLKTRRAVIDLLSACAGREDT